MNAGQNKTNPFCSEKSDMNRHVSSVHEGKKPFKCDICDYTCSLKQQMKTHVVKKHKFKLQF